jgi:hypothetical protein
METRLEVKPSTIPNAGNGVFTIDPIKKGSRVCYYAGKDYPKGLIMPNGFPSDIDPYSLEHPTKPIVRIGYRKPEGTHGVAQLINDGAKYDPSKLKLNEHGLFSYRALKKLEDIYYTCALQKANVEPSATELWVFVAYRDISAGEELFFCYTHDYWASQHIISCEHPLHKVIVWKEWALEHVAKKDNEACRNLMDMFRISDGGPIHQAVGVQPTMSDYQKLKCILNFIEKHAA